MLAISCAAAEVGDKENGEKGDILDGTCGVPLSGGERGCKMFFPFTLRMHVVPTVVAAPSS